MRKILFVDDDPVVLTLYRNRLQREGFQIEVARDGRDALNMLPEVKPDLVVLDLMLPEVNGVEVLKFIRGHAELKSVPVLVLSNAYLTELANKAMKAGANKGILKNQCNPTKLVGIIQDMIGGEPAPDNTAGKTKFYSGKSQAQSYLAAAAAAHADEMSLKTTRAEFLKQAANEVATIREHCLAFIKNCNSPEAKQRLNTLYQRVHFLSARAGLAGCAKIALLASAFEALLFDIVFRPVNATPSALQTMAQAVDALGRLFQSGDLESTALNMNARVLVVDDDPVCNLAMVSALKRAHLDPVSTEDPRVAMQLLEAGCFDIVLLDINMPQVNGFELCEALRRLPQYKMTPVIFITGNGDFQNRARSVLSGGNDLITKPTSPLELVLKTTMYLLHTHCLSGNAERRNIVPDEKLFSEVLNARSAESVENTEASNGGNLAVEPAPAGNGEITEPPKPEARADSVSVQSSPESGDIFDTGDVFVMKPAETETANTSADLPALAVGEISAVSNESDEAVFKRVPEESELVSVPAPTATRSVQAPIERALAEPIPPSPAHPAVRLAPSFHRPARKQSQQPVMQNKYSQAFDEISHEVARIIFGEENLTELNVRLARIALERYNVHEIINRLGETEDARGHASRLSAVSA